MQIAGPNLGESWFTKEIGQALVLLEGEKAPRVTRTATHGQIRDRKLDASVVFSFFTNSRQTRQDCSTPSSRECLTKYGFRFGTHGYAICFLWPSSPSEAQRSGLEIRS